VKTISVDKPLLGVLLAKIVNHILYKLGAKAPSPGCDSTLIREIDCSGLIKWLLERIAGLIDIPDGSYNQRRWFQCEGFKQTDYANCGLLDGRLRIAFIDPKESGHGHVWLVWNGKTIESYGGDGVGRRKGDVKTLLAQVAYTVVLTDPT
jgi:hypothetical protein